MHRWPLQQPCSRRYFSTFSASLAICCTNVEASSYRLISLHHILLRQTFTKAENYPRALQTRFTVPNRLRCPGARSPIPYAGRGRSRGTQGTSQTCSRNPSGFKMCVLPRRGPPVALPPPAAPRSAAPRRSRPPPRWQPPPGTQRRPALTGKGSVSLSPCWERARSSASTTV